MDLVIVATSTPMLLVSILFVPQCITTDLTDFGSTMLVMCHKTFTTRSPPVQRLIVLFCKKKNFIQLDSIWDQLRLNSQSPRGKHRISFIILFGNNLTSSFHPERGRHDEVLEASFCLFQPCRSYVSNETLNNVSVERWQDVTVVCLQGVIEEHCDNVSRVRNNDVPLVHLHKVSN